MIVQAHTLKQYSAQLSLTTLICFVGTLQAIVVTFAMERKPSVWTIGFDMNLLAAAYAVSLFQIKFLCFPLALNMTKCCINLSLIS